MTITVESGLRSRLNCPGRLLPEETILGLTPPGCWRKPVVSPVQTTEPRSKSLQEMFEAVRGMADDVDFSHTGKSRIISEGRFRSGAASG